MIATILILAVGTFVIAVIMKGNVMRAILATLATIAALWITGIVHAQDRTPDYKHEYLFSVEAPCDGIENWFANEGIWFATEPSCTFRAEMNRQQITWLDLTYRITIISVVGDSHHPAIQGIVKYNAHEYTARINGLPYSLYSENGTLLDTSYGVSFVWSDLVDAFVLTSRYGHPFIAEPIDTTAYSIGNDESFNACTEIDSDIIGWLAARGIPFDLFEDCSYRTRLTESEAESFTTTFDRTMTVVKPIFTMSLPMISR